MTILTYLFFIFYALVSSGFVILWGEAGFWAGLPIAIGIFMYGLSYFVVHDIFIHQRFKILRNINNKYARGLRRAHKMHHKNIHKEKGECFEDTGTGQHRARESSRKASYSAGEVCPSEVQPEETWNDEQVPEYRLAERESAKRLRKCNQEGR